MRLLKFFGLVFSVVVIFSCNNNSPVSKKVSGPVTWATFNYDAIPDPLKEDPGCDFSTNKKDFTAGKISCVISIGRTATVSQSLL